MCVYFTSSPLMCFLVSFLLQRYRISRVSTRRDRKFKYFTEEYCLIRLEASQQFLHILESSPVKTFFLGIDIHIFRNKDIFILLRDILVIFDIFRLSSNSLSLSVFQLLCAILFSSLHQPLSDIVGYRRILYRKNVYGNSHALSCCVFVTTEGLQTYKSFCVSRTSQMYIFMSMDSHRQPFQQSPS